MKILKTIFFEERSPKFIFNISASKSKSGIHSNQLDGKVAKNKYLDKIELVRLVVRHWVSSVNVEIWLLRDISSSALKEHWVVLLKVSLGTFIHKRLIELVS